MKYFEGEIVSMCLSKSRQLIDIGDDNGGRRQRIIGAQARRTSIGGGRDHDHFKDKPSVDKDEGKR